MRDSEDIRREQSLKKSILWNALEPGDPYDIRKSMIAALPGQKQMNMAGKQELVCLLQAAQIERLSLNLYDYRVKLRQQQNKQLDRHSYQLQIKQLAGKLQGEQTLKQEITKLRNFIDRLNKEYEDKQHQYSTGNTQLSEKYQQALQQVYTLGQENQRIKNELEQLREEYRRSEDKIEDYENKFSVLGVEIERLNRVLEAKNDEASGGAKMAQQLRRQKQNLLEQIANLEREKSAVEKDLLARIRTQLDQARQQVVRVRHQSEQAQQQINQSKLKIQQYQQDVSQLSDQLQKVTEQRDKLQQNSTVLGQEVERLNSVLRSKVGEVTDLQSKFKTITEENQFYVTQSATLEQQAKDLIENRQKLQKIEFELGRERQERKQINDQKGQYEARIRTLTIELERVNALVQKRNGEGEQYEQKLKKLGSELNQARAQAQAARRQHQASRNLVQQEEASRNSLINKLNQVSREYEAKISQIQSEKNTMQKHLVEHRSLKAQCERYENQIAMISLEVDRLNGALAQKSSQNHTRSAELEDDVQRLNNLLRLKVEEAARWESSNSELANRLDSAQVEINNKNAQHQGLLSEKRNIQTQINTLTEERHRFISEISQYKSKFEQILGQVQRLQSLLERQQQENSKLNQLIRDLQIQLQQQSSKQKTEQLQAELKRLYELIQDQREEIKRLRLCTANQGTAQDQNKQQLSLIVVLFAEIQSLRARLTQQEEEAIHHHRDSFL